MRTFVLVGLSFGLLGCGAGKDSRSDLATPAAAEAVVETVAVADARPAADAMTATVASAVFTCGRYQTYCGGIDRFVGVCRARDAAATVVVPMQMSSDVRFVVATYKAIVPRVEAIQVRSCATQYSFNVTVDAELLESQYARDLAEAEAMLARM